MTTTPNTTGKKTYRVYADFATRRYQEVEAASPREAFDAARRDCDAWQDCYECEDRDMYQLSDNVEDASTGEFIAVGEPARCRTCGSDVVEGVNGSTFHEGECGPCEYRRYRTQPALLEAAKGTVEPPTVQPGLSRETKLRSAIDSYEHAA